MPSVTLGEMQGPNYFDPSTHLAAKFATRKDELLAALANPDFYIEWMLIGIALVLAWLVALLIRRHVGKRLAEKPLQRIDPEFITKPLSLLAPLLALLYLGIIKPLAESYAKSGGGDGTELVMQLCIAWILAKCVLLIVRSRPMAWFIAVVIMVIATLRATGFIRSTAAYLNSMAFDVGQFHLSMLHLVRGSVILVVVFWVAGLLSRTLESYLRRSSSLSYNARELTVKFFRLLIYFIALMITLSALGVDLTAFAVFGGALGVGVGLGLQKITANFISGITMLMEKSIQIGDLIEVGGVTGHVRELNIRYALIAAADGREILIPNEELLTTRVTNWTHTSNNARIDVKIGVAYKSDPAKVIALMLEAAGEHKFCLKDPPPSCFLREFGDNALIFLLTFWIPDVQDGRMQPQSEVMMAILEKFKKAKIGIPCPAAANVVGNL